MLASYHYTNLDIILRTKGVLASFPFTLYEVTEQFQFTRTREWI